MDYGRWGLLVAIIGIGVYLLYINQSAWICDMRVDYGAAPSLAEKQLCLWNATLFFAGVLFISIGIGLYTMWTHKEASK